jgi:hypothetical protein
MAQKARILGYLGDDRFVIGLKENQPSDGSPDPIKIKLAHDYVEIEGMSNFMVDDSSDYKSSNGVSNWVKSRASIQIGIREFKDILLPLFMNAHYLSDEHFKMRKHEEDDKYFERYGLESPRWTKGEEYPPYTFNSSVIEFFNERTQQQMVTFRRAHSLVYETVTKDLFDLIRPQLELYKSEWDMKKVIGTTVIEEEKVDDSAEIVNEDENIPPEA